MATHLDLLWVAVALFPERSTASRPTSRAASSESPVGGRRATQRPFALRERASSRELEMAKERKRGNKEAKKPKQPKRLATVAAGPGFEKGFDPAASIGRKKRLSIGPEPGPLFGFQ
jgi:hypothetical protein